ncbi:S24 family peptidase [Riemerella anatipestifer]|uniref:S24 family peptidase n=1 Tax=Riemerella anatipestifer TaxID=34085 RepID=UPI00129DCA92|nr:S24 family peptidase [Riemerella anatipestifer]MRN00192.1 S24 family peptidase [Riemerella anatipestifer]MRN02076.1 S24 family peptidase [Riemerella anatipestifer]
MGSDRDNLLLEVKSLIDKHNITAYEVEKYTPLSAVGVQKIIDGSTKRPLETTLQTIKSYITNKYENTKSENLQQGELKPKTYKGSIQVRLVTNTAKAGWVEGFYADEYLKDMPIVVIEAEENYKGNYMAFEIEGDSMEPDYVEGDTLICREVQRHLWQSKLHYKDWDFVIAHAKEGIFLKEIIDHDVEKGIITCRSLNPKYKDRCFDLREVAYLYNVVEVRQKGKNKRWNRVRDFL